MHTIQILWFLLWPVSIFIAYRAVLVAVKRFERMMSLKKDSDTTSH